MSPWTAALRRRFLFWAVNLAVLAGAGIFAWRAWWSHGHESVEDAGRGAFSIFVLGGSAALGDPYAPNADFGQIVSLLWQGRFNGRPIRVVNLGGPGKTAGDALVDTRTVARSRYQPGTAVAFLYLGNNEFLRFDQHRDPRSEVRALFDQSTVSATERDQVHREYRESIEEIIRLLQNAGVAVIASTMAVNTKDWEPNRSMLRDPATAPAVERLLRDGERERQRGRHEAALSQFRNILAIDSTFALAWKRAGDCHRRSGRFDLARACYQKAIDLDGNPYRETSEQTRILREVCARRNVPVVDAARLLEAASPESLIGFELMWDNCHPTLEGYARISRAFAEIMAASAADGRHPAELEAAVLERALGIDAEFNRRVTATRGQYCYLSAMLTFDPTERLAHGESYLRRALTMKPDDADVLSSLAILTAVQGRRENSLDYWRQAYRIDPRITLQRASHPYVRGIMERLGVTNLPRSLR